MRESETEVLIIGAGPTGLFVAGELARHGVRARIVDQSPAPHAQTRATGVQAAALEVLHRAGLADAFLRAGVPVKGVRVLDAALREAFSFEPPPPDTPYPYTCSLPQWRTEEILAARLDEAGVGVERGVTAAEIALAGDGARICPPARAGVGRAGAVLVRPDGYVGFQAQTWTAEARTTFESYLAAQFAR